MRTLVKSKVLFDSTDSQPLEGGCMVYEDGKILAVGRYEELSAMEGIDQVLDHSQQFVMPGLVDAHNHLGISHGDRWEGLSVMEQLAQSGPRKICKAVYYLKQHLQAGETFVRDMGEDDFIDFDLKRAGEEGYFPSPRISPCGAFISPTHGHGQTGQTVSDGVEQVRKNCRVNLAKGADLIKVFGSGGVVSGEGGLGRCTSTADELRTAVEEAQMMGKYVAAHVHGGPGIDICLDVGVRSLEHATLATDSQIHRMARMGSWVTVTYSPMAHPDGVHDLPPDKQERLDEVKATYRQVVQKMYEQGIHLCVGCDGVHGGVAFEAKFLEQCGIPRKQILEIITREGARASRWDDRVGSLRPGLWADFIALDGNPLEDLENLTKVQQVYLGGKPMLPLL